MIEFFYCKSENRSRECLEHRCRRCGTPEFYWSRFTEELEQNGGSMEDYLGEVFFWAEWQISGMAKLCETKEGPFEHFIDTIIEWVRTKKPLLHFQALF